MKQLLNKEFLRMQKLAGIINEDITLSDKPVEDSFLTKSLNSISRFIKDKDVNILLDKIRNINGAKFDEYTLKYKEAPTSNQFIIDIEKKIEGKVEKVGKFVAFIYTDKTTNQVSLQIQKVEIFEKYKGKGVMRNFYQSFNKYLKDSFPNFANFTSDFIFLYNTKTQKYDGFNMWEDLVKKGLAKRLGPDENYIPPTTPPRDGMWRIKTGYALK